MYNNGLTLFPSQKKKQNQQAKTNYNGLIGKKSATFFTFQERAVLHTYLLPKDVLPTCLAIIGIYLKEFPELQITLMYTFQFNVYLLSFFSM